MPHYQEMFLKSLLFQLLLLVALVSGLQEEGLRPVPWDSDLITEDGNLWTGLDRREKSLGNLIQNMTEKILFEVFVFTTLLWLSLLKIIVFP
jgi:hypothetical protein